MTKKNLENDRLITIVWALSKYVEILFKNRIMNFIARYVEVPIWLSETIQHQKWYDSLFELCGSELG